MKRQLLDLLFLCTLGVLTWEKIRWETPAVSLTITNLFALAFVVVFLADRLRTRDLAVPAACITLAGLHGGVRRRLPGRLLRPPKPPGADLLGQRAGLVDGALRLPHLRRRAPLPARPPVVPGGVEVVHRRTAPELRLRPAAAGAPGGSERQPGQAGGRPAHRRPGWRRRHQRVRPGERLTEHLPSERTHRRPQPPGRDAVRAAAGVPARLSACPQRAPADGLDAAVSARCAGADAVAVRGAGRHRRPDGAVPGAAPPPPPRTLDAARADARWWWPSRCCTRPATSSGG